MWEKSMYLGCACSSMGTGNLDLMKEQYELEYPERFNDLKKQFFNIYSAEADSKLFEFLRTNAYESFNYTLKKANADFKSLINSESNPDKKLALQILVAMSSPGIPYYMVLNVINALLDKTILNSESLGEVTIAKGFQKISGNILNFDNFYSVIDSFKDQLLKLKTLLANVDKTSSDYSKSWGLFIAAKSSYAQFEIQLKRWIENWKTKGIDVESYEDMKKKVEDAVQSDLNPVKVAVIETKQDLVPINQEVAPIFEEEIAPNIEKKSKAPILIGAAALAYLLLGNK